MADTGGLLDFIKTPEGQGLLSAAFTGMATAQRGTPWNNFGRAGVGGIAGYLNAQNQEQDLAQKKTENQLRTAQTDKLVRDLNRQKQIDDLGSQYYVPGTSAAGNAMNMAVSAGERIGPTNTAAALLPLAKETPGSFDMSGYMSGLMKIDPMAAMKMQQDARKANEVTLKEGEQVFDRGTGKVMYGTPPAANMTYHPGDGYRPDVVFDSKRGFVPMPNAVTQPSSAQPSPYQPTPQTAPQQTMPQGIRAPWEGMPAKQADEMRKQVFESESKKLQDLRDSVAKGKKTLSALEQFGELNRNTGTGSLADRLLPDWLTTNDDKQNMLSIQDSLAPAMRAPGSGSSSDTDVRMMKSGLPGINKSGDVNKAIRQRYNALLNSDAQELAFKERYLAQNGHLNGADEAFQASQKTSTQPSQPAQQAPLNVTLTPNGKMLSGQKRAALDAVIASGNPTYLAQARAKGWIK